MSAIGPLVPAIIGSGQNEIGLWRSPCLFDESVQQNHALLLIDIEEDARDLVPRQIRSDLVQSFSQWPACRHSDRPTEFDGLNVLAYQEPVFPFKGFEPLPHRLVSRVGAIKDDWNTFQTALTECTTRGTSSEGQFLEFLPTAHG